MTMGTLTQYLALEMSPWIQGVWGTRWKDALGGKADGLVTWAKDGVKSRFVLDAPVGGLPYLGKERGIEREPGESDEDYRARLWGAWETWVWAGTQIGVCKAFETCGFTLAEWSTDAEWPEAGHVWPVRFHDVLGYAPDNDNDTSHWARFWVALDAYAEGYRPTAQTIGDGSLIGEGYAIGIQHVDDATCAGKTERWAPIVRKWKGAHTTCKALFVILSDGGWGDIIGPFGQLIGDGATIGATVEPIAVGEL